MIPAPDWSSLAELLRRPPSDRMVTHFLGPAIAELDRDQVSEFRYVEAKAAGLEVVFGTAARVVPASEVADPQELRLIAFHLHRAGHEGYAAYCGTLPGGATMDDEEWGILRKLGAPASSGGGGTSAAEPGGWIPCWIKYQFGANVLRFQSDREGCVEMATLMAPDLRLTNAGSHHRMTTMSMPSRLSLLWRRERDKGAPLTELEVRETCDNSAAVALPLMVAAAVEEGRGYRDIIGDDCWDEWQRMRPALIEHAKGDTRRPLL